MSVATEPAHSSVTVCERCGSPLADDQEWCLECGSARTLIHSPPDWRVPLALVAVIAAIGLIVIVIALVGLSTDANRLAAATSRQTAQTAQSTPVTAAQPPTQPTTPAPPTSAVASRAARPPIPDWPLGLGGWTVVLTASSSRAVAFADARRLEAAGLHVGVLNSSRHPSLTPGLWVVFDGRYPTSTEAQTAATRLQTGGHPLAHIRRVAPPGG